MVIIYCFGAAHIHSIFMAPSMFVGENVSRWVMNSCYWMNSRNAQCANKHSGSVSIQTAISLFTVWAKQKKKVCLSGTTLFVIQANLLKQVILYYDARTIWNLICWCPVIEAVLTLSKINHNIIQIQYHLGFIT